MKGTDFRHTGHGTYKILAGTLILAVSYEKHQALLENIGRAAHCLFGEVRTPQL